MTTNESQITSKSSDPSDMREKPDNSSPAPPLGASGTKQASSATCSRGPQPLTTSKLANQLPNPGQPKPSFKVQNTESSATIMRDPAANSSMDHILAKLSEQQVLIEKQQQALTTDPNLQVTTSHDMATTATCPPKGLETSSSESASIAPVSDTYSPTPSSGGASGLADAMEMMRLKQELEAAKNKIAYMDQELSQSRITKHTLEQAMGSPSEADFQFRDEVTEQTISNLQNALNESTRPVRNRQSNWYSYDDTRSDHSDGPSVSNQGWPNAGKATRRANLSAPSNAQATNPTWDPVGIRAWADGSLAPDAHLPTFRFPQPQPPQRPGQQHIGGPPRWNGHYMGIQEPGNFPIDQNFRRGQNPPSRPASAFDHAPRPGWNLYPGYPASVSSAGGVGLSPPNTPFPYQSVPVASAGPMYQQQPIGTRLSPTAAEFSVDPLGPNPWNAPPNSDSNTTYVAPVEPINYRKLLDRNMSCNWKYIVDKIVCNNDQQASIFLQQKLKVGTTEQKFEIVEAIIAQAYPLMINRFGNFLIQRCFEHGTPEQVIAIANAIRGNTLNLSMDAFGCHVIQKAFDAVPEEYKAIMVHELLRRIPETVIHRYACHVWQKLFELRWSDSPPQIMKYVNEALRGMWHEVALGETGSLVVQNIFENCLEEDKRPCINEVLASIDIIAHGQFGNWCIQHICEHGAPADRSRAIDHIIRYATEYSMDQYASKVIEKCLKIGGTDFLERYLERVCEGRPDRPRMPLIDIAGDQFGNYLIQYILTHANPQHREVVATHVRKHMVSLRGSKYGSRVAMLCCNPAFATRPGPPVGMQSGRYNGPASGGRSIYGGAYR